MKVYKLRDEGSEKAEYIGRGSMWGNPFVIGKDGTREEVIEKFEKYAEERLAKEPEWLAPLQGKDVVCFCAPLPCHGDVILRLLRRISIDTTINMLIDEGLEY